MTRRRNDDDFAWELREMLLIVPAWVGPSLAMLAFLVLRFLIPAIFGGRQNPAIHAVVVGVAKGVALPGAVLVLLIWLLAECQKWRRRRLLNGQSGLGTICRLPWREFEHLAGEAYRRQGYVVQETGSACGDGGFDLLLSKAHERVLVQCKQWRSWSVGVKPVRELFGVMNSESATRGILVTSGSFTREAKRFAEGKPLDLVERSGLWELVRSVKAADAIRRCPKSMNFNR